MLRYLLILFLLGNLYSQDYWINWAGEWTSPEQREFARKVYEIGYDYGDYGHTAVSLGWQESSLGADTTHPEPSYKRFGLSRNAILDVGGTYKTIDSLVSGIMPLEREVFFALKYFDVCKKKMEKLGYTVDSAWYYAAARYNAGNSWSGKAGREYAETFNRQVKYLKEIFME